MRPLKRATAIRDATAGVALAAMSIPQSLGYAAIAGMPAVTGFYTLLLPALGFAAFGSSRYLVVAADSATAAILAGGISGLEHAGTARYIALAGMVAAMTAGFLVIARLLKLGFIADFLSQTVLVGFLTGVGFQVGIAVLGQMLRIPVESHRTAMQLIEVIKGISQVHLPSLGLSGLVVGGVFAVMRLAPKIPGGLIAVLGSVAASALWNFKAHGIRMIDPVMSGLPHFTLPDLAWKDAEVLVPVAFSCFIMIVTQSAATARVYAARNRQQLDENADLAGLAAANGLAAFTGTFVVNGSLTQTGVVEGAGSSGQFAQICMSVVVGAVLLFFTRPLEYLPRCVLGAIVFIAAIRLLKFKELRDIQRESPGEFWLAAATAVVVVVVGVEQGIVLAMVMSLLRIVQHSYHPHTAVLVEGRGGLFQLTAPVPGTVSEPGLVIYRFGAPLFYANAGRFANEIRGLAGSGVRWILVDAGAITKIDYSAARGVRELLTELADRHVGLALAHVEPELQADLDRHHLTGLVGPAQVFDKLHDAVAHFRELARQTPGGQ